MADLAARLARNLRLLRGARGLTQAALAKTAGLPRATWAHLETGAANPTLEVLSKAAGALGVSLEELLAEPRSETRRFAAAEIPTKVRGDVTVRKLLPDPIPAMHIDRMELPAGARLVGVPHTPGTREYLTCERGQLELRAGGERWVLEPGDVVVFRGDQRHGYANPGRSVAIAYSVVILAR